MLVRPVSVALLVLSFLVAACGSSDESVPATSPASAARGPAPEGIDGVVAVGSVDAKNDRAHVNGTVTFATRPPTRGPHNAIWQNCGFYTRAVADENAVHSLEHGAVWITYREDADAETRAALASMAKANPYLLITPYPANPTAFVLTAWGRQLQVDRLDDPRVARFISVYARTGPTVPEKGAPCSRALGVPPDRPSTLAA